MCDGGRGDETIRWVGMKAIELASQNGDLAGQRQFSGAAAQYGVAHLGCRLRPAQPSFGDEKSYFPKADRADRKLIFSQCPLDNAPQRFPSELLSIADHSAT